MTKTQIKSLKTRLRMLDEESADAMVRHAAHPGLGLMLRSIAQVRESVLRQLDGR